MKFGQVPRLLVKDGETVVADLVQSRAIARYLGRTFGLYQGTDLELAQQDQWIDAVSDVRDVVSKAVYSPEKEKLIAELKTNTENHLHFLLNIFNKAVEGKSFLVGDKLSIADLWLFCTMEEYIENLKIVDTEKYAHLVTFVNKIKEHPNLKAYITSESRPKSFYN